MYLLRIAAVLYQDDHSSATEYVNGHWFDKDREVDLKQEPQDVCCVIYRSYIQLIKREIICIMYIHCSKTLICCLQSVISQLE